MSALAARGLNAQTFLTDQPIVLQGDGTGGSSFIRTADLKPDSLTEYALTFRLRSEAITDQEVLVWVNLLDADSAKVYERGWRNLPDSTIVSDNANYGLSVNAVRSLGPHWSAGGRLNLVRNTFSNIDGQVSVGPAVEYNLYPYAESTRRQLRLGYSLGVQAVAYQDTTLFLKTSEVLGQHELSVAAEFSQPWGSVDVFSGATQFLAPDRFDKYRLYVGGGVELRVLRGLSVRLDGQYSFVRNQIGLRADNATDGEILTNQFELATGYSYFGSVGISYSFGSIFNQVVNPRLPTL